MFNILILEDHPMMVESIRATVRSTTFKIKLFVANSLLDLDKRAHLLAMATPALVVADLNVPDSTGLDTLVHLRARYADTPILVFSQTDDRFFEQKALAHGATAFVSKSRHPQIFLSKLEQMLNALHEQLPTWLDSQSYPAHDSEASERLAALTPQQKKVLAALASGLATRQIAEHLELAEQTVRAYLAGIFQRLEVKSRSQAIVLYLNWKSHNEA
jgi:DNA-binding NarL/FixJ family response regulator